MCDLREPAPALLGSTLLANEEKLDLSRPSPLSSGLDTLDREALDGGFRYGEITAVAGANGTGKTLVSPSQNDRCTESGMDFEASHRRRSTEP